MRTTNSPTSPTGDLVVGIRIDEADVEAVVGQQPGRARRAFFTVGREDRRRGLGEAEHLDERLDPEPAFVSRENRGRGRAGEDAAQLVVGVVGALAAASRSKSIITPTKFVTVAPESRS